MNTSLDNRRVRQVESGRVLTGILAGADFVALVTIVGASLKGDLAHRATYASIVGLCMLGLHFMVTLPGHEGRYQVSRLMTTMTVIGVFASILGLSFLFEMATPGAGFLFGVLALLTTWVCVQSEDRAARLKMQIKPNSSAALPGKKAAA